MILEALVSQLEQRFQHEKRARVCLWFDERSEFARLLPLLEAHIASHSRPPFVLLAYDGAQRRVYEPLRTRDGLPRGGLPRGSKAELRGLRRALLPLRAAPRRPRPEGRPEDGVRTHQAASSGRRSLEGGGRGVPRLRDGSSTTHRRKRQSSRWGWAEPRPTG